MNAARITALPAALLRRLTSGHVAKPFLAGLLAAAGSGCGSDGSTAPVASPPGDAPGVLILAVRTVGDQVDSDGYTVVLDQAPGGALPVNGESRISGVAPGAHSLEVLGIASNCRLTNRGNPGSVSVSAGATVRIDLEVFCLQPDPGKIFYSTAGSGVAGGSVRVMNALGGDRRVVPGLRADRVELSPDGERIVFNWDDDIWVADADGSNPVNLTNSPDQGDRRPAWSPDGQRIAYAHNGGGSFDIFVMNADGSGDTNLTPNTPEWGDLDPDWSPDGSRIVFLSNRSGVGDLWIMAPDGTQLAQLTRGFNDGRPRFSPDSEKILFSRFTGSLAEGGTEFDLFVIHADGTGFKQLTSDDRWHILADWSPDGRWIVFDNGRPGEGFELFVMRADGTDRLQLTFSEMVNYPSWVP